MCLCSCLARAAVKIDQRMSHHVLINLIFRETMQKLQKSHFLAKDRWIIRAGKKKTPREGIFSRKIESGGFKDGTGLASRLANTIDSRLRNFQKKIDVKTIKMRSSNFYDPNFMFFPRLIQQVLHSLRDSDAMIRKTWSFPTFSSVNGFID